MIDGEMSMVRKILVKNLKQKKWQIYLISILFLYLNFNFFKILSGVIQTFLAGYIIFVIFKRWVLLKLLKHSEGSLILQKNILGDVLFTGISIYLLSQIFWVIIYRFLFLLLYFLRFIWIGNMYVYINFIYLAIILNLLLLILESKFESEFFGFSEDKIEENKFRIISKREKFFFNSFLPFMLVLLINLAFNVKYIWYSFDNEIFIINDIAMYMSIIQSISHNRIPPVDLIAFGKELIWNPVIMTNSFIFYGILLSNLSIQGDILFFIIAINALNHAILCFLAIKFVELISILRNLDNNSKVASIKTKINISRITTIFITLVSIGSQPFNSLIEIISGKSIDTIEIFTPTYERLPDGNIMTINIPGLGVDLLLLSFHHGSVYIHIMYTFIITLLLFKTDYFRKLSSKKGKFLALLSVGYLSFIIFFHPGIGIFVLAPIILFLVLYVMLQRMFYGQEAYSVLIIFGMAILTIFLIITFCESFIYLQTIKYVFTFKITSMEDIAYIAKNLLENTGINILIGFVGFLKILRKKQKNLVEYFLTISFIFLLLIVSLFNVFKYNIHTKEIIGSYDYFPWLNFQFITLILGAYGLECLLRAAKKEHYYRNSSYSKEDVGSTIRIKNSNKYVKVEYVSHLLKKKIIILIVIALIITNSITLSLNLYNRFHVNLGNYYYSFYRRAIRVNEYEYAAYKWISTNTEPDAIFIVSIENWELVALAGRTPVYAAYRLNTSNQRYIDVITFFTTDNITVVTSIISRYNISYIMFTSEDLRHYGNHISSILENDDFFTEVYDNTFVYIYKVKI